MHIELIWLQEILSDRPLCIFAKKGSFSYKNCRASTLLHFYYSNEKKYRFKLIFKMKSFKSFQYSEFLVFTLNQPCWEVQPQLMSLQIQFVKSTFAVPAILLIISIWSYFAQPSLVPHFVEAGLSSFAKGSVLRQRHIFVYERVRRRI